MTTAAVSILQVLGRPTVHPFPARMAPGLAVDAISNLRRPATVLDPMVGSGTVIAIARANGHRAIGFDVDPLAVLISRVWTRTIDESRIRRTTTQVLERARQVASSLRPSDAYPVAADLETRSFVRYWFDHDVRRQLAALAVAIREIETKGIQEVMWCAFSRQIIAKQAGVSLALDLPHSRPHRVFKRAPRKPFAFFLEAVERVIAGCINRAARYRGPVSAVKVGDARRLPVAERSVDLVYTSPPYLNAIDYLRCSKFSLVWMGYSITTLRRIRSESIGAEVSSVFDSAYDDIFSDLHLRPELSPRMAGILGRYVDDTHRTLKEVARVLAAGGRAVYVVGENTMRGTYIPTGQIVSHLAGRTGLHLASRCVRNLPGNRRYLPPPGKGRTSMDTRIRREVILTFKLTSGRTARASNAR